MPNDLIRLRGKFSPDLVDWVINPTADLSERVEREIDRVMEDRRKRVQVFLTGLVKRHVERIVFLMGKFPQIEEELFTERRIKHMKNSDLIRLLSVVAMQVEDASDFLQRFVSADDLRAEPLPSRRGSAQLESSDTEEESDNEEEPTDEDRNALEILPAESRKRVMRVFRRLLTTVELVEQRVSEEEVPEATNE
jgi:ABC-type proline/glycine betaine transport system ATPase subunit